jgi:inosine/xanthosine triphosphatase
LIRKYKFRFFNEIGTYQIATAVCTTRYRTLQSIAMKVIVGSTNPVKINAARAVFSRIDPAVEIISASIESGVPIQPWGDEQTRQGAVNRATAALQDGANYAVGFEGGVIETELGIMTCAWCAVIDASRKCGIGGSGSMMLPPGIQAALRSGEELGPAMDALVGQSNIKHGPGAVGILTDGLTDRQKEYEHMLILALAPFRRPDLYEESKGG